MSLEPSIETLQARIAQLEAALAEQQRAQDAKLTLFRQVFDNAPGMMVALDRQGRVLLVNQRMSDYIDIPVDQLIGKTLGEALPASHLPTAQGAAERAKDEAAMASGQPSQQQQQVTYRGETRYLDAIRTPLIDSDANVTGLILVLNDITERKRDEEERANLSQRVIEAQEAALREISTPLIPITDGVLVMPLIGSIDSSRAQQILESLLEGITTRRVQMAILDVTGLRVVDTHAARALVQAAHSARLLGAQVLLTGIRAEVAQALVQLGADLGSLATLSNLQSGIAYALRQLGRNAIV